MTELVKLQWWPRHEKETPKRVSPSKSENVACTATRASPPQFRSVFGQSLVGRGDTCTSGSLHLQKGPFFLFKQTCCLKSCGFSPPGKHTFFPEPFLRRESGPCGFPFNSSTDLYVFTCAQSIISVVGMIILFINIILHIVHILKCSPSHVILLTSELVVIPIVSPSSS